MDLCTNFQSQLNELLPLHKNSNRGAKIGSQSRLSINRVVVQPAGSTFVDETQVNPSDGGTFVNLGYPVWEAGGPVITDINQNQISDCYFLAALASLANNANGRAYLQTRLIPDPNVQNGVITIYVRNGIETHIHSDILVATFGNNSPGDLWPEIFEKTYALFREGADTYASLNYGNSSVVASDLGCTGCGLNYIPADSFVNFDLFGFIRTGISSGQVLCFDTPSSGTALPNLVQDHTYAIVGIDASNNVQLYNPWGILAPDQNRIVAPADITGGVNFSYLEYGTPPVVQVTTPDPVTVLQQQVAALQAELAKVKSILQS